MDAGHLLSAELDYELRVRGIQPVDLNPTHCGHSLSWLQGLIQQGLELRGSPKTAIEVCLASITLSTIKQYLSGLKLWYQFCHTKNENCFSASATVVLEFLQEQYDRGVSYGTLNSYQSTIAQLLGPSMAEDILIRHFLRAYFICGLIYPNIKTLGIR
nr:unnamed protein product [Callosobruchus chinensis]